MAANHLHLPGVTTNFVFVPNVANLDGTGTLVFIAKVALDKWTPDANQIWVSKWTGSAGYLFFLESTSNDLKLMWRDSGPARIAQATVTPTVTDGDWLWVMAVATEDGVDRDVFFYTSTDETNDPDDVTWIQLGAEVVVPFGAGDLTTNTAVVFVGAQSATVATMAGDWAAARVNFAGVTELDIDFTDLTAAEVDAGSFTEDSGNAATVEIRGTAWAYVRPPPIQTGMGGAVIRFLSSEWDNPLRQDLFRYARARLMLNIPARYRIDPGDQEWAIFSDTRFTLDQVAAIGALSAYDLNDLPAGWELPDNTDTADRAAAEAQIQALIDATWISPDQMAYDDPNPWQAVLDANGAPDHTKAEPAPDPAWRPVEDVS